MMRGHFHCLKYAYDHHCPYDAIYEFNREAMSICGLSKILASCDEEYELIFHTVWIQMVWKK